MGGEFWLQSGSAAFRSNLSLSHEKIKFTRNQHRVYWPLGCWLAFQHLASSTWLISAGYSTVGHTVYCSNSAPLHCPTSKFHNLFNRFLFFQGRKLLWLVFCLPSARFIVAVEQNVHPQVKTHRSVLPSCGFKKTKQTNTLMTEWWAAECKLQRGIWHEVSQRLPLHLHFNPHLSHQVPDKISTTLSIHLPAAGDTQTHQQEDPENTPMHNNRYRRSSCLPHLLFSHLSFLERSSWAGVLPTSSREPDWKLRLNSCNTRSHNR